MLFVGEIGLVRREYLYELAFWEMRLTMEGYQRRSHAGWEQARLIAYQSRFAMGNGGQTVPPVDRWIRFPWEEKKVEMSREEVDELQAMMKRENERLQSAS